ncbi:hypothetical protein LSH36_15g04042 [Paralvinella palmiformis]|uniref:Uncharacterized protein n=1 Tax=Paralvinella palmiformis TaxID=53620 RepID=A0AAD9KDC6_9ANNE|nr:hypothetical protein LSH36_15g04042 [Paralvinella palmiformis]
MAISTFIRSDWLDAGHQKPTVVGEDHSTINETGPIREQSPQRAEPTDLYTTGSLLGYANHSRKESSWRRFIT